MHFLNFEVLDFDIYLYGTRTAQFFDDTNIPSGLILTDLVLLT